MSKGKSDYYLGIDLGTTNSVISWGSINRRRDELKTQVINIPMRIDGGGIGNKELLPSYVYFREGDPPSVGEYARAMIGRQTDRVVKSVKSHMGTQEHFHFDGTDYSPAEISSMILKQLSSAAREINIVPENVVITVPASFDSDQRSATIEAGELAGFQVTLFDEPRAALYDFAHRQDMGELPSTLIDFDDPKIVLVFDLGGGTLDVSLHKVSYEQGQYELTIEDIAIGRYTQVGGDNFDKLLAEHFLDAYSNRLPQNPNDYDIHLLETEFQVYAEIAKIDLSGKVTSEIQQGNENWESDDIARMIIQAPSVNPDQLFQYNLTLTEYEQIVEPLLASDLSLDSVDESDSIPFTENIIYPILDVLRKAKKKLNVDISPTVDAVLLNGGMTRLHTIRKRLEDFFGFPPITAGEPDKSVARGASVYHYRVENGHRSARILNDTIGIELEEGKVKPLVEAGTVLPLSEPRAIPELAMGTASSSLRLPFYLGSRLDTDPPNRKILERRVQFERPIPKNERIILQVTVDERGILAVEGWPEADPDQKFTATVDSGKQDEKQDTDSSPEVREEVQEPTSLPNPETPIRSTLEVRSELDFLSSRCSQWANTRDRNRKNVIMEQITGQRSRIKLAENAAEFITPLIDCVNSIKSGTAKNFLNGRIMILLGDLVPHCSERDQPYDIFDIASTLSEPTNLKYTNPKVINTVVRYAIEAIGKTKLPLAESHLIGLLNQDEIKSIRPNAIYSIGKCSHSVNAVKHLESLIKARMDGDRIAVNWALGKIGSRENVGGKQNGSPLPLKGLYSVIANLLEQLELESHPQAQQHGIYALAEICDRRNKVIGDIVPDETANKVVRLLNTFSKRSLSGSWYELASLEQQQKQQQDLQNLAEVAKQMIEGGPLSSTQEDSLLKIREADL